MIDIQVTGLVKSFDLEKQILDGLSFQVDQGERVGLLGKNGAGKSTLFQILCGTMDYDAGQVRIAPGRRVGLISQIPVYQPEDTVEDVLQSAFAPLEDMAREMEALTEQVARGEEAALRRYGQLQERYEGLGGYDTATAVNKVCNGLSIPAAQRSQLFDSLSGGEKTRVNLARLILEDTDILLLDEPTNHLDLHAVEWLEDYLSRYKGTVLTISHDRYFLDRVVGRIIEVADGKAEFYSGNYSFYAVEKERRYLEQMRRYEKEQAKIAQLQKAEDQLHLWAFMGNDALHKRAFSIEKRIQRMQTTEKPTREKALQTRFAQAEFHADEVLNTKDLGKGFDGRTLFSGLNLKVEGGERIALLGDNGCGKSTLLKILLGEELPDQGRVKLGPAVRTAYLPQIIRFDDPRRNMVDTLIYAKKNFSAQMARNRLAAFHFQGEDVFKSVGVLSGGEQSRLRLCLLMDEEVNFLILDEPTNHLDIASREWIEEAVEAYDGTLLFVSHDRYFIGRFATRIWEMENGTITDYPMDFRRYRALKAQQESQRPAETEKKAAAKPTPARRNPSAKRLLTICERDIARREEQAAALEAAMEENACNAPELERLYREKQALEQELEELMERWEQLAQEAGE